MPFYGMYKKGKRYKLTQKNTFLLECVFLWVADRDRTGDLQDHNLTL